jgi:hypothetical protein
MRKGDDVMAKKKTGQDSAGTEKTKKTQVDKGQKAPKAKAPAKEKKISALDAAAKVLAETGQPMNCQELIKVMADKGYWTSPGGLTPHATLYSAILRELKAKGAEARFKKADRGKFAATKTE